MKRRILILALALAAVTAVIGTTVASLMPVQTAVYIYENENPNSSLKFVGNYDLSVSATGTQLVTVNIVDTRPNPDVPTTRTARNSVGAEIKVTSATSIDAPTSVVID